MYKIGVISDTHIKDSKQELPKKLLEDFKKVDMIIHCGDLVDLSVLDQLKKVCNNVLAVWGNMDPEEVKNVLHKKEIIELSGHKIGVVHGWGPPGRLVDIVRDAFEDEDVDIIVYGHTHAPYNEEIDGVLYFNPGSATDTIFSRYNSYGIIELNRKISARIVRL